MTLSASEKAHIQSIWTKASPQASALGDETLRRLYQSFPQIKSYFSHFDSSADKNGNKIFNAVGNAAAHMDDLDVDNIKKESENVAMLSHFTQVVLAYQFPQIFSAEAQAAWDKFLTAVYTTLDSK